MVLSGIRVIDMGRFIAGPMCAAMLADLGADVIRIERIEGGDDRFQYLTGPRGDNGACFLQGNRNKRSLTLDLKKPEAIEIARKLIATADVIAENFRPGVLDKLGLGFEAAKAIKPDIIYAAASGYGTDGPYVNRPGQDLLVQALSGLATITGTREHGPRAVGVSAIDHHGAALFAGGILAALVRKERTGQGGRVDVSLLSAAIDLQMESFTCYLNGERPKDVRQPGPIAGWYYGAPYGVYATKDGHVAISLGSLDTLGDALGIPAEQRIPDSDAFRRRDEATPAIAAHVAKLTTAECVKLLEARSIWHAAVNDYSDVVADPQVTHNKSFQTVKGATGSPITLVSHPIRYDGEVPEIRLPPQKLGAQSEEILRELGYDATEVQALCTKGAVGAVA